MRRVRPVPLVLLLGALALTGCGGREVRLPPGPSPSNPLTSSPTPTGGPTPSPSASLAPAPRADLQLPRDAPTVLAERVDVADLAETGYAMLLPPGAGLLQARTTEGTPARIALAWYRGEDPFARQSGLVIWQRFPDPPPWRAVFAFTDRPGDQVLGIALEQEDLTGDAVPDLLVREDTGGTGACARWRVVVSLAGGAEEAWRHEACDTSVDVSRGRLVLREAIYGPEDPHCCPSALRLRTLAFDGTTFVEVRTRTVDIEV